MRTHLIVLLIVVALAAPGLLAAGNPRGPVWSRARHHALQERRRGYILVSPWLTPRGSIQSQPHQRTLTVVDTPEAMKHVAELLAGFDLPPRTVEVAVQLILPRRRRARPNRRRRRSAASSRSSTP